MTMVLVLLPKQKYLQPKANPFIQSLDIRLRRLDLKVLKMRNYFYVRKLIIEQSLKPIH